LFGVSKINEKNTSIFVENSEEQLGIGSGIILTSNGFILSNCSTTGDIGDICYVTLKNGSRYPAEVKWIDKNLDISIIKISAENLLFLTMGDSNKIEIGEKYYILSNALGFDFYKNIEDILIKKVNITTKIVDKGKTIYAENIIKANIDLNFENNGGAVLNENGEVLGIVSQNINSIIPINRVKIIIERLKENENYREPYLGIYGFDNDVLKYLNSDYQLKLGILVDKIEEDSPAKGKIFVGDIITKIDNFELSSFRELRDFLLTKSPKDKIGLTVIRESKEETIYIILKEESREL